MQLLTLRQFQSALNALIDDDIWHDVIFRENTL